MISHGIKSSGLAELQQQRTRLVNQQLVQNLAKYLGLGAGVGLVARGAQGAYNLGRRVLKNPNPNTLKPTTIDVPMPVEEEAKLANAAGNPVTDFLGGSNASSWTGHPLAIPGVVAAAGGGAIGSWKLMDYVLDNRRKAQMKAELAHTKRQYEQALLAQYDKRASELGRDLDQLFTLLQEKQAADWMDAFGQATGTALLGAGGIAMLSGAITHNIAGKRRRQALLQKALRKRRREQAMSQPTRIFAVPQPIMPTTSMHTAPTEEDLNGNPLDKVAAIQPQPRRGLLGQASQALKPPVSPTPKAKPLGGGAALSPVPGAS